MGRRQKQNKKIVFSDTEHEAEPPLENVQSSAQTSFKNEVKSRQHQNGYKIVNFEDKEEEREGYGDATATVDSDDEFYEQTQQLSRSELKQKAADLYEIRKTLPVFKVKDEVMPNILSNRVTILIGETGSGKSTQIPHFLMDHVKKGIAVTQPRRVAAMNLAMRVSEEYGCHVGEEVGYSVRFNNMTSRHTKLKYITDGMLLRELMLDPKLSKYSIVVVDEAHERTILTDLLIGFLKGLLQERDDFQVVIMSATLDAEKFSKFFNDAPILFIEGKMYPVERYYIEKPVDDIIDSLVKTVIQVNQGEESGDILCFLPGQEDIDKSVEILQTIALELPKEAPLIVPMPLYAALPPQEQMKIFNKLKPRQRKVIISTNIAETSVTVPGIKYVIDSGLRKVKVWRHQLGLSTLLTVPISQASATQRAGRAGRESSGKCFRLYKEGDYMKLTETTEPEILRSEIISPVLMLKKLGVDDILGWHWLENPGRESLIASLQQLYALGALDNSGKITELGEEMVTLPVAPHLASVLIKAREMGVLEQVIDIVSCLSVDNLLLTPPSERRDEINAQRFETCSLGTTYGDLIMLKELFDIFNTIKEPKEKKRWCRELALSYKGFKNAIRIKRQLQEYMGAEKQDRLESYEDEQGNHLGAVAVDVDSILQSFLAGFVTNTAIGMPDRSYRTVTSGALVAVHPSSLLFGQKRDAIMYVEHVYTVKGYARSVSAVKLEWLQQAAPTLLSQRTKT